MVALAACPSVGPEPEIRALAPTNGYAGETIEVLGTGFTGSGFVTFGSEVGVVTSWDDERICVRVPTMRAGVTTLVVTADGRQSLPIRFEVMPETR